MQVAFAEDLKRKMTESELKLRHHMLELQVTKNENKQLQNQRMFMLQRIDAVEKNVKDLTRKNYFLKEVVNFLLNFIEFIIFYA